jgi:hypothetical protein
LSLTLEDLDFFQFSFELRFAHSYLLWDRAGRIWQETTHLLPNATVANAQPNKIVMRDGPIELTMEPNHVIVQLVDRERLKAIPAVAAEVTQMVSSILELSEFTRVGLRMIYRKVFPTREAAAAEVMKFGLLKIPEDRHFGVAGLPLNPEIAFRREEGSKGFSIRIKAEGIEYKFELPLIWHNIAKPFSEVHESLTFDIDSYVKGTILPSQIAFEDWITQTLHVIRRDANGFLGVNAPVAEPVSRPTNTETQSSDPHLAPIVSIASHETFRAAPVTIEEIYHSPESIGSPYLRNALRLISMALGNVDSALELLGDGDKGNARGSVESNDSRVIHSTTPFSP